MPPQQHALSEEPLLPSSMDHDDYQSNNNNNNITDNHEIVVTEETVFSETERHAVHNGDSCASPPRNIKLILLYTWVAFTGRGLWNQNCLATMVFLLRNGDAKAIGFLTAVMGMAQLGTSIPTGILADKHRRDTFLKAGAVVGIGASGVSIGAALRPSYGILMGALILWGIHWGVVNTSIMALFSDSIPDGQRSFYFTRRAVLINFANACGLVIALVMFAVLGDTWTIRDCSLVLLAGNTISLPGLLLLCWMRDHTDDDEDVFVERNLTGSRQRIGGSCDTTILETTNDSCSDLEDPLLPPTAPHRDTTTERLEVMRQRRPTTGRPSLHSATVAVTSTTEAHRDESYDGERLGQALTRIFRCHSQTKRIVPSMIATADVMGGIASGMSIRYIAIFLYDNLHLNPVAVQLVYLTNLILQVLLRKQAQRLARIHGRCKVTVCLKWVGISLMLAMVISYKLGVPRAWVCVILVLRTCFMNSGSPLTKSVLMDHVPKEERAKWASLESVSMVSWSGSAALGGILVERQGILFNFCFTAFLQFLATGPLVLLSLFVDRNNGGDDDDDDDDDEYSYMYDIESNEEEEDGNDDDDDDQPRIA